jgi:hypothetical protein
MEHCSKFVNFELRFRPGEIALPEMGLAKGDVQKCSTLRSENAKDFGNFRRTIFDHLFGRILEHDESAPVQVLGPKCTDPNISFRGHHRIHRSYIS